MECGDTIAAKGRRDRQYEGRKQLQIQTNNPKIQTIMYTFQAYRISQRDNVLFPDKLEIDDQKVIYYKGRIFGYESTTIQRSNIGSVSVDAGILFATVYIETNGGQTTRLDGFSKSEARQIQRILSAGC